MSDLKAPAGRVAGTPAKAKPPDPPAAPGVVIRNGRLVAGSALAELRAREQVALDRERELRDGTPVGRPLIASGQALVGAVQRIDLSDEAQVRRIAKQAQEWQTLAWAYFDVLGTIKYPMRFLSNSLLRVVLFAGIKDPDNPEGPPIPVHEAAVPGEPIDGGEARPALLTDAQADQAAEAVARLQVPDGGQGQLLADLGICLSIPGEAWLLTEVNDDGDEEITVRSDRELIVKGDRVAVRDTPTDKEGRELGPDADLWRLWRRHPAWRGLADSNMRSVLDDCSEFLVLRRMFASMGKSRMNGGALIVSSDASFGRPNVVTPDGVATPNTTEDPFDVALANYLVTPVGDEASPANVAPAIIRVKGEFVKDVHWLDFGRKITDAELKRAAELVTSIAQGLDLPVEVLTGIAGVNHWGAWMIDESLYRAHVLPLLTLIAGQLASGAVRPWLRALGWDAADAKRIVVGINASELVADPDRSKTADEAHDRLTISDATHRRDKGYGDDDAPDDEELARRMDAKRPAPPFGGGGGEPAEEGPPEEEEPEAEEPVVGAGRRRRGSVGARLGELDRGLMARLSAAAETAMDRALDRAGARLRNLAKKDHVATAALTAAGAVDNPLVASVVGEQRTAVLVAAADEDLLDGAFDQLEQRFDTWVKRTQAQARSVVGRVGASDADLADLEAEQDEDRVGAWAWLAASMAALARARMFDPNPDVAPLGEVDASVRVPPALMRNALARAGGATPVETATGGVVDVLAGQPVGGVATGDLVRKAFASVGLPWTGYVWDYGDPGARSRPFPPHEELDGVEFATWDDPVLANSAGEWPHVDSFRPGDHRSCQCGFTPLVPDGSAGEPEGGTVTDEAEEE